MRIFLVMFLPWMKPIALPGRDRVRSTIRQRSNGLRGRRRDKWLALCPAQEAQGDRHIEQVPPDAVDERGPVGAGEVEDRTREPAAERHAEERRGEHDGPP